MCQNVIYVGNDVDDVHYQRSALDKRAGDAESAGWTVHRHTARLVSASGAQNCHRPDRSVDAGFARSNQPPDQQRRTVDTLRLPNCANSARYSLGRPDPDT
jgi:hypothetical protein